MVLGCYWLTKERLGTKGEGKVFGSPEEVRIAFDAREVEEHARIKVRIAGTLIQTTVGRVLLSEILPPGLPFANANKLMTKKEMTKLIDAVYRQTGHRDTVEFLDKIKDIGFTYATRAGLSICIDNMHIPSKKEDFIGKAQREVNEIEKQYSEGLITNGERYNKVIDIWAHVTEQVANEMMKELGAGGDPAKAESFNPIFMMADSGARGSSQQIRQLGGMRGLMAKPSGEIIETPITANFREGLTVLQYFISTHGARKGLAETALKTANSGYLTRRLVDVAQDMVVRAEDCGTQDGLEMGPLVEAGEVIEPIGERILGRVALHDVVSPIDGAVIVHASVEIDEENVRVIEDAGIERVLIRSGLTCETLRGVCVKCYGRDLARGAMVNLGEAVGVIAAQSIGEPGTQLTMRTFHLGGAASRAVEQSVHTARHDGSVKFSEVHFVNNRSGKLTVMN